ncbi:MAG: hypothetical protein IJI83_02995 [Oscillospiraceae bacterium]|nr:hypothetical protein [Oscillospiraceae bacterium]
MNENKEMAAIGRCRIDKDKTIRVMETLISRECEDNQIRESFVEHLRKTDKETYSLAEKAYENTFPDTSWMYYGSHLPPLEERAARKFEKFKDDFGRFCKEVEENALVLKCFYQSGAYSVIGYRRDGEIFLLPNECIELQEYRNYDELKTSERKRIIASSDTAVAKTDDYSKQDLLKKDELLHDDLNQLEQQIRDVEEAKTGELKALQDEINRQMEILEKKKAEMTEVLEKKKSELEAKVEDMKIQIYRLDSEIYAIRAYTGEIVEMKTVRSGRSAEPGEPMVIYQKIRYLDEELGRLASIYNVDYSDAGTFEKLLEVRDDVLEYFAPNKRSVSFVKVSRSGKGFGKSENSNILVAYDKYHGDKVAIILKDGDNVYISWTDDERIDIQEDAFYKPGEYEGEDDFPERLEYESDERYNRRLKAYQKTKLDESLSRYFIFQMIQGLIDRNFVSFPEKVSLFDSEYIKFSYADNWIETNQYGTFAEMIRKCNSSIRKGDFILTTQHISPSRPENYYRSWVGHNDRGRGWANRTHDVSAKDNTVYSVNLIENYYEVEYLERKSNRVYKNVETKSDEWEKKTDVMSETEIRQNEGSYWYKDIKITDKTPKSKDYYVSLEKDPNWATGNVSRANFQLYDNEFINLTFMNSVWLEYVLVNAKSAGIRMGGESVDFAHTIPYLKTALAHVRKREQKCAEWIEKISADILTDSEWPVRLTEWMLENDYHNFSQYRMKQFCGYITKETHGQLEE